MPVAKKRRYDMTSRAAAAAQTRQRILRAAYALYRDDHYDDITIPRIAEAAGVSAPSVVQHFRTKEGLFHALVEWWEPQEDALREVADGDPVEAARRICARYDDAGAATLRVLAIEDRVPAIQPLVQRGRDGHRAWVERTFGAQLGSGAARERRVMALVAAYDVYTWHVLRRVLGPEETILAMADLARGVLSNRRNR